jgi:hypothetical protein
VTPNWTVGRKSSRLLLEAADGARAGTFWAISCSMRVSRTLTRANSAATKKPLARMSSAMETARKKEAGHWLGASCGAGHYELIEIISARKANRHERRRYDKGN